MVTRSSFIGRTAAAATSAIAFPSIISAAPAIPLKIAAFPIDPEGVIFFAKDLGYFDDAGLDVTFVPSGGGGPQTMAAMVSGDLDLAVTDPTIVAAAHLHGVNFRYIAPAAIATPETRTDTILVMADSKITKAADLNGKTIGTVSLKGLQQLIGMTWVDKHGGDSKTLKFLPLGFTEMLPALQQGRVDAVLTTEPFVESSKSFARQMGNVFDGIANRYLVLGFFASDDWLAKHSDAAATFCGGDQEGRGLGEKPPGRLGKDPIEIFEARSGDRNDDAAIRLRRNDGCLARAAGHRRERQVRYPRQNLSRRGYRVAGAKITEGSR